MPEQTGTYTTGGAEDRAAARDRHAAAAEEAPPRPKGLVDLEEFDSTLYFLDEARDQPGRGRGRGRVPAGRAAARAQHPVRPVRAPGRSSRSGSEILGVIENLFPNFLNARDFRTAAAVLRESRCCGQRVQGLAPALAPGSTASSPS